MATSEIEKLERRYAENPQGLTFAPLAEVHRKNGDVPRALELLAAGLELHPNYIPASIVLGRCHQDLNDLPSAEAAFAHVLRLDDENVIALKSLADINERLERFVEAENWLRRLVSIDRSNDEAREQLQRIEAARQGHVEVVAETAAPAPLLEMLALAPQPVVDSPAPAAAAAELPPVESASIRSAEVDSRAELPPEPEPLPAPTPPPAPAATLREEKPEVEAPPLPPPVEPAEQEETVEPLAGLISAEFQPPLEAIGGLDVETSEEVVLDGSGNSEFRVPDASEDLKFMAARLSSPPSSPAAGRKPEAPPEEPPQKPESELEFLDTGARTEPPPAPQPAGRQSYVAADTKGQSVEAFFRALVASRPPSSPDSSNTGDGGAPASEPTPAGAVSFDDFFNSETDGSSAGHRNAPGKDDLDQFQSWLQNLKR